MPPIQSQNTVQGSGPGPGPGMSYGQKPPFPFPGGPNPPPPPPGFTGPSMPMAMPPLPRDHPQAIHARATNAAHAHMQQSHQGGPPYPPPPPRRPGGVIGGAPKSRKDKFPVKLMEILTSDLYGDSVAWLPHGRSFIIHSPERFTATVLPKYFKSCKFSSFTRKLYRWGFRQISKGPDAESFFHKHFRRDKKTLCNMIVCGKEIRDGCPELHEGINAQSLLRLEQAELRDNLLQQRQETMARENLARQAQQALLLQGQAPSASGAVSTGSAQLGPASDPRGGTVVGAFSTQDIDALKAVSDSSGPEPAKIGALTSNAQETKQQPVPTDPGVVKPSQPGAPQVLAPSGQPINSAVAPQANQNQLLPPLPPLPTSATVPSAVAAGPGVPAASLQSPLPPSLDRPNPTIPLKDGSLEAIAASSDPVEIQARIDAMQARILELKRRQLAELEAKHAELQLLEAEEEVRVRRQAAAIEGAKAEAFEKAIRLRHEDMAATGVVEGVEGGSMPQAQAADDGGGKNPLPQLPPVAVDTRGGALTADESAPSVASEFVTQAQSAQTQAAPAEEKVASFSAPRPELDKPPTDRNGTYDASCNGSSKEVTTSPADTDLAASQESSAPTIGLTSQGSTGVVVPNTAPEGGSIEAQYASI